MIAFLKCLFLGHTRFKRVGSFVLLTPSRSTATIKVRCERCDVEQWWKLKDWEKYIEH